MDGVTDAACRFITAKYGQPSLIMTEFTAVEGLHAGATRLLTDFIYHPIERPICAQLFGAQPDAFYEAAIVAGYLGFDGIDLNMGCPAKNITEQGAGAALINDPIRATQIILQAQAGAQAWANGISLKEAGIHPSLLLPLEQMRKRIEFLEGAPLQPKLLPVSIKTRIGYDKIVITDWIQTLLGTNPAAITIHGRTLKQLYTGTADWDAIRAGAAIATNTDTLMLGNGDLTSIDDGLQQIKGTNMAGFLIGRQAVGNPWIFSNQHPPLNEKLQVANEHARLLAKLIGERGFVKFRKHLLEYTRNLPKDRELRMQIVQVNSPQEVEKVLAHFL